MAAVPMIVGTTPAFYEHNIWLNYPTNHQPVFLSSHGIHEQLHGYSEFPKFDRKLWRNKCSSKPSNKLCGCEQFFFEPIVFNKHSLQYITSNELCRFVKGIANR